MSRHGEGAAKEADIASLEESIRSLPDGHRVVWAAGVLTLAIAGFPQLTTADVLEALRRAHPEDVGFLLTEVERVAATIRSEDPVPE